jgi:hypothetical protein
MNPALLAVGRARRAAGFLRRFFIGRIVAELGNPKLVDLLCPEG